ncbi:putative uncharacterized protein [Parachlamydia acanthamoebae UV-7]|uniref:Pyruvate phosphate dikinase AMP/ATP-binding domain-containing protein n=2 Tax=Parachlamydia acanthamoebae TaxID=83552 RepID=F8KZ46_PARAV|nr:PEP/pyruvate-binding domain-containing protein [Parachlamydia acanthamoebae]EFB41954.1 hypothetical protein pah_c022o290 [Parachlamydia acanthamoebae str. Hall's coccus]KIA78100.1 hypothetical protein DB43_EW00100 [Parachlamydia acanthamoebae]CCB86169.1 putative uncharacterized protein [Parachlamydia acanthamoebae UV-7]
MIPETNFGHKAANLIKLNELCHLLSIPDIQVRVPPFICFAHSEIFAHIQQYYPEYLEDWTIFTQIQKEGILFSPDAQLSLWKIQENLIHLFANHPFESPALDAFIGKEVENNQVLVVRSTGREDGETFSNAGGNRSESGILPEIAAISAAIGKVIASYHSVKSLRLRIFGEDDPYSSPFLSVFVQVMVGEIYEKNCRLGIPVSGILHTQEILGHTPKLIQIQALYGHNEALVKNIQPCDSFYVYPDDVHAIIRFKKKRMVPSLAGEFVTIDNPWELRTSATLNHEQLFAFYQIAGKIQAFYKKMMEVEWVYSHQTLYLVQARPLIETKKLGPSFVNESNLHACVGDFTVYQGETIASKGAVTLLTGSYDLLQDVTLEKGFNHYLQESKPTAKAIFARLSAAATSHAACSLREQGIEVLCGIDVLPEELDRADAFALIDPQQGKLFIIHGQDRDKTQLWEWLSEKGVVEEGWTYHPIPSIESIPRYELETTLKKLNFRQALTDKEIETLFREAHRLTENIPVQKLVGTLAWDMQTLEDKPILQKRMDVLLSHAHKILQMYFLREVPRKQRLHALKRLEALFFQKRSVDIVETDSRREILQEQYLIFQMEKFAVLPQVKMAWKAFIEPLFLESETLKKLEYLIHEIQENQINEEWINIAFAYAWKEKYAESSKDLLNHLEAQFKISIPAMRQIASARQNWNNFRDRLALWALPEHYERLWREFKISLLLELNDVAYQFFSIPDNQWLIRVVLLKFLQESIEMYDLAMKELKSSSMYHDKALQVFRFREMLIPFLELMKIWVTHIPSANIEEWIRSIEGFGDKLPGDYRQTIIQAIQRSFNQITSNGEEQLLPSTGFNVNALVISSAYFKSQELPTHSTLEDLCSLMHQNILIAQMTACIPLWEGKLPSEIYPLHHALLSIKQDCFIRPGVQVPVHANWVGVSYHYPCFSLKYNIPVKNHSTIIDVTYHLLTQQVEVEVRIIGHNRGGRMETIGKNVCVQSIAQNLKCEIYPEYDARLKMLLFRWRFHEEEIKSEKKLKIIIHVLVKALEDTLAEREKLTALKLENLDKGNVQTWKTLWDSKENTLHWFKAGAPYFHALMQRCFAQKWDKECQAILSHIGLHFQKEDSPLFSKVFFALVNFLHTHPRQFCAFGSENRFFGLNEFSAWALEDILNDVHAIDLLISQRERLVYTAKDPAETKIFYLALHVSILQHFLQQDNQNKALDYAKFLISHHQDETIVDLNIHSKHLAFPSAILKILEEGSKDKIVDGYPVSKEIALQSTEILDMHGIKKERRILVKLPHTAHWIAATVIKSSPPESLAEPFGSLKIRVSRGRVQKVVNPFGVRLLPI